MGPEAYLIYVWIKDIHPLLWRRFLDRSDSTLADLHQVLQIGFGWSDFHLHRFRIRKKDYAVPRSYGTSAHDARDVSLANFNFRHNERFIYEYHFGDWWRHQLRIEERLPIENKRTYPVCVAGRWAQGEIRAFRVSDARKCGPTRSREQFVRSAVMKRALYYLSGTLEGMVYADQPVSP